MKTAIVMLLAALAGASIVNAAEFTPVPQSTPRDVRWTPAQVQDVQSDVITVSDVVITAKSPAKAHKPARQTSQCGAFQFRPVTQGPASSAVRGFCL